MQIENINMEDGLYAKFHTSKEEILVNLIYQK